MFVYVILRKAHEHECIFVVFLNVIFLLEFLEDESHLVKQLDSL